VLPPEKVGAVEEFGAVVLGSAVYMGQWMKPARELAERSAAVLATRPVWLFSSGPAGEPAKPAGNPVDVTKILQASKARDHQIFTGKLARKHLSFPDRAMASAIRAAVPLTSGPGLCRWAAGVLAGTAMTAWTTEASRVRSGSFRNSSGFKSTTPSR
jgi:menaquinone-dependent protoporphyrinogen oxidase